MDDIWPQQPSLETAPAQYFKPHDCHFPFRPSPKEWPFQTPTKFTKQKQNWNFLVCCWSQFLGPAGMDTWRRARRRKKHTLLRVIPTMTSIRFVTGKTSGILSDISSGILSGILSGISSGILPGISSAICSGISSGALSGISSGKSSDILSGILSGKSSGICSGKHSGTLSGIPSGILSDIPFYLAYLLAFYLAYLLAFYLAYLLAFYLANIPFWHFIWHIFWHSFFWHSIWPLRSSGAHWARRVPGWGPAVLTELGRSQVEVQRCSLSSEGPRLRSSGAQCAQALVPTACGSWRRAWRRVGKAEVNMEVEAEVVEESLGLHKALSGGKAVDEWSKCISQHFDIQPTEVYGAVIPKVPSSITTVKLRIAADKASAFELKSGTGGIAVRRWIPKGAEPPKTPVVWLKGSQANSCAPGFEGFLGLVRRDHKYASSLLSTSKRPVKLWTLVALRLKMFPWSPPVRGLLMVCHPALTVSRSDPCWPLGSGMSFRANPTNSLGLFWVIPLHPLRVAMKVVDLCSFVLRLRLLWPFLPWLPVLPKLWFPNILLRFLLRLWFRLPFLLLSKKKSAKLLLSPKLMLRKRLVSCVLRWLKWRRSLVLILAPWIPSGLAPTTMSPRKLMPLLFSCKTFALICPRSTSILLSLRPWHLPCPVLSRLPCPQLCLIHPPSPVPCGKTGKFDYLLVCCSRPCGVLGMALALPCWIFSVFSLVSSFRSSMAFGPRCASQLIRFNPFLSLFSCTLSIAWFICIVPLRGIGLGLCALPCTLFSWLRLPLACWIVSLSLAQLADLHVLWLRPPVAFVVEPPLPLWISPPLLRLLLIPLRICLLCLCRTLAIPVGLPRSRVCFTPVIFVFPVPCPPGVRRLIAFLLLVFMMAIKKILALSLLPSVLCSLNGLLSIFGLSIAMPRALCASLSSHLSFWSCRFCVLSCGCALGLCDLWSRATSFGFCSPPFCALPHSACCGWLQVSLHRSCAQSCFLVRSHLSARCCNYSHWRCPWRWSFCDCSASFGLWSGLDLSWWLQAIRVGFSGPSALEFTTGCYLACLQARSWACSFAL